MKTLLSVALCAIGVCVASSAAMANPSAKKEIRTDRVSVSSNIQQFDINPFTDSKRVVRNDRVSYSHANVEKKAVVHKKRILRNDRMIVCKEA